MHKLIFQIGNMLTALISGAFISKYTNSITELIIYGIILVAISVSFWILLERKINHGNNTNK